jgi:hypothetical protein
MSTLRNWLAFSFAFVLSIPSVTAQANEFNAVSFNGSTGLFAVPSGQTGWGKRTDLGIDVGYQTIVKDEMTHLIRAGFSLFKWVELTAAFDMQPDLYKDAKNNDLIIGFKIRLPASPTAVAIGGNYQALNLGNGTREHTALQVYLATTYAGTFFGMPAETTLVVGKTFILEHSDSDIDFGMGFDLVLFPKVFRRYIHWITDFANFSYSSDPYVVNAVYRGILNTGIRIDLGAIPALKRFKFTLDVVATDIFDQQGRSFSAGAAFGFAAL